MDPQEHSFTRTIDEEAELEESADREREEGHQEQDEDEEDRELEVMTAGSESTSLEICFICPQSVLLCFMLCAAVSLYDVIFNLI